MKGLIVSISKNMVMSLYKSKFLYQGNVSFTENTYLVILWLWEFSIDVDRLAGLPMDLIISIHIFGKTMKICNDFQEIENCGNSKKLQPHMV